MRIFLKKIFFFVILLLLLSNSVQSFVPYYWGNPGYSAKMRYLNDSSEEYNVFFFGSSRIYRHIDPVLFDRVSTIPVRSYNMGAPATFTPEIYYLLKNFIKDSNSVENGFIFVELRQISNIDERNLHTSEAMYFVDLQEYLFAIKSTKNEKYIRNYSISFFEKTSGIGVLHGIITSLLNDIQGYTILESFGAANRGYYTFDMEVRESTSRSLVKMNKEFLKNPETLEERKENAQIAYQRNQLPAYDTIHLNRINDLIQMAKKKGFHMIFVLEPKVPSIENLRYLVSLFDEIDDQHKIDLGNPEHFPAFYFIENSWDVSHFNESGAKLFTTELAAQFNKLLDEN